MEESEKRRERLKAMRMEAARAGVNTEPESSELASHGLSNPLIESDTASTDPVQYTSPRFDYYTDPMAAFSANRKRNNFSPRVSQGYYNTPPRPNYPDMTSFPTYQNVAIDSPGQRVFQAQGAHYNQSSLGNPMGAVSPLGTTQGNPPNSWGGSGGNFNHNSPNFSRGGPNYPDMTSFPTYQNVAIDSPGQRVFQAQGAHYNQSSFGNPMGAVSPLGTTQGNPPNSWGGSGGNLNHNSPNFSRGGKFTTTPGFVQGDSPNVNYGRGRSNQYSSSSHSHYDLGRGGARYPDSRRGRARSLGNSLSPASGPSGRRGAGSHNNVSAELRPDLYYRKEMVEDPWKLMNPVIWKALDSDKSWLPKSIGMKKARASSEAPPLSISQSSLAEYLATSFNETHDEKGV